MRSRLSSILLISLLGAILYAPLGLFVLEKGLHSKSIHDTFGSESLQGVTLNSGLVRPTPKHWLDGSFQDHFTKWFAEWFRGRNLLVRCSNQIDYTLFRKSAMANDSLCIAKDRQLFEKGYIEEYCNLAPPMPASQMETVVRQMADLQGRLKQRGIPFLVLVTPSKAALYPQYIPDDLLRLKKPIPRDYDMAIPLLKRYGVSYLDAPALTAAAQTTTSLPLYCQGGIHWNTFGVYPTMQALLAKFGEISGKPVPQLALDGVTVDDHPTGTDDDLARLLNLMIPPTHYQVPHARMHPTGDAPSIKHAVFVGGSFTLLPLNILMDNHIVDRTDLYYYWHTGRRIFTNGVVTEKPAALDKIDWDHDIFGADVIVVEINEEAFGDGEHTHYMEFMRQAEKHLKQ